MNGGYSQAARVLIDAMRPLPLVAVKPVDTFTADFYLNATDAEWEAALAAKYGAQELQEQQQ